MREFFKQLKWQVLIFQKNNFLAMIFGITAFYMVVIYFLKDLGNIDKFMTLLILNEPSLIGFMFIGLSIILDKDQEVLTALFITPINHHLFLWSRLLTLTGICLICSWGVVWMAKGTSFNFLHFSIGTFTASVFYSFVGVFVVSFTTDILHFILRSIPLLIFMGLPLFNYFEFTNISLFNLFPVQGSIYLITNSYAVTPSSSELIFGYISVFIWFPLLYWGVYSVFKAKMINT